MLGDPNINFTVFVQNSNMPESSTPTKFVTPPKTTAPVTRSIISCYRISFTRRV